MGIINSPVNGEVTIQWTDLLAPGEKEKIENMSKLADVVQKTTGMYGGVILPANSGHATK